MKCSGPKLDPCDTTYLILLTWKYTTDVNNIKYGVMEYTTDINNIKYGVMEVYDWC